MSPQTLNKEELVTKRPMEAADKNFILATWLRGLYYGDTWYGNIPKQIFMENYHKVIESILVNENSHVVVACLKDDPEVILGYAVYNIATPCLHWIFIKKAWRAIGIAKTLVSPNVTIVTHMTKVGASISKKHPQFVFNPFVI